MTSQGPTRPSPSADSPTSSGGPSPEGAMPAGVLSDGDQSGAAEASGAVTSDTAPEGMILTPASASSPKEADSIELSPSASSPSLPDAVPPDTRFGRRIPTVVAAVAAIVASGVFVAHGVFEPAASPSDPAAGGQGGGLTVVQRIDPVAFTLGCPTAPTIAAGVDDLDPDDEFAAGTIEQAGIWAAAISPATPGLEAELTALTSADTSSADNGSTSTDSTDAGASESATPGAESLSLGSRSTVEVSDLDTERAWAVSVEPGAGEEPQPAHGVGTVAAASGSGDGRGLAAASCVRPGASQWLVGPGTDLGHSTELVLTNPGVTAVTVGIRLWGAIGELDGPTQILLPPGTFTSALLEAYSLEPHLAVEVSSNGGNVGATLIHQQLDGLAPQGIDYVAPASVPSQELVIPGFNLTDEGEDTGQVVIANPGTSLAQVSVEVLSNAGARPLPGADEVPVEAQATFSIPLVGLGEGTTGLRITSDQPVTAAAQIRTVGTASAADPGRDVAEFAWIPATDPVSVAALVIPDLDPVGGQEAESAEVETVVHLTNPSQETLTLNVTVFRAAGSQVETIEATIDPESTIDLATELVEPGDVVIAEPAPGFEEQQGAVLSATLRARAVDGDLIAVLTGIPDDSQTREVAITLR